MCHPLVSTYCFFFRRRSRICGIWLTHELFDCVNFARTTRFVFRVYWRRFNQRRNVGYGNLLNAFCKRGKKKKDRSLFRNGVSGKIEWLENLLVHGKRKSVNKTIEILKHFRTKEIRSERTLVGNVIYFNSLLLRVIRQKWKIYIYHLAPITILIVQIEASLRWMVIQL